MYILTKNLFIKPSDRMVEFLNYIFFSFFSEKLNVDVDTVHHGVEGLMYLLTESSKLMVST